SNGPGASVGLPLYLSSAGYSTSSMSVDLPEPETPVTHTRRFSGIRTSMFFRLCSRAPRSSSHLLCTASATTGTLDPTVALDPAVTLDPAVGWAESSKPNLFLDA